MMSLNLFHAACHVNKPVVHTTGAVKKLILQELQHHEITLVVGFGCECICVDKGAVEIPFACVPRSSEYCARICECTGLKKSRCDDRCDDAGFHKIWTKESFRLCDKVKKEQEL